eukprot:sb/3471188/
MSPLIGYIVALGLSSRYFFPISLSPLVIQAVVNTIRHAFATRRGLSLYLSLSLSLYLSISLCFAQNSLSNSQRLAIPPYAISTANPHLRETASRRYPSRSRRSSIKSAKIEKKLLADGVETEYRRYQTVLRRGIDEFMQVASAFPWSVDCVKSWSHNLPGPIILISGIMGPGHQIPGPIMTWSHNIDF